MYAYVGSSNNGRVYVCWFEDCYVMHAIISFKDTVTRSCLIDIVDTREIVLVLYMITEQMSGMKEATLHSVLINIRWLICSGCYERHGCWVLLAHLVLGLVKL